MTNEERIVVACAARRTLAQQLERDPYVPGFARLAIDVFMRTYDVEPAAARPLLERLLDRQRLAQYGRYELPHLAHAIDSLHDADALSFIYRVLFSDVDVGTGSVALGAPSVGLNLVQDAAQSVTTSQYALAQHFAAFLGEYPAAAIGALASALNYSLRSGAHASGEPYSLTIGDHAIRIAHDLSQYEEQDFNHIRDWWTMVAVFEERLRKSLAAGDLSIFNHALQVIPQETTGSFLWRVMLRASGVNPTSAAIMLPFVTTRRVLESSEFGSPLRDYLSSAFPRFDDATKEMVFAAFLESVTDNAQDAVDRLRRNRVREFIAVLPLDELNQNHPLSIALGDEALQANSVGEGETESANLALNGFHMSGIGMRPVAISEGARNAGAAPELIAAIDSLETYFRTNPRKSALLPRPAIETVDALNQLSQAGPPAARRATLDLMWMIMRDALGEQTTLPTETFQLWQTIALEMVAEPPPLWNDEERLEHEGRYAEHGYLTTRARNEGVEILYILFSQKPSPPLLEAIRALANDIDPSMRADVVQGARFALQAAPDEAWDIIEAGFADSNVGVWVAALSVTRYAPTTRESRVHEMYVEAFTRIERIDGREDLRISLVRTAIDLAFRLENTEARERLTAVVNQPWEFRQTAGALIFELANTAAAPSIEWAKREWAAEQLLRTIVSLVDEAERLQHSQGFNVDAYPPGDQERARDILKLLFDAAQRMYYASEIEQRVAPNGPFENTGRLAPRSYALLRPLIVALGRLPFAHVSFNTVKLLWGAIDVDPRDVLLLACSIINNGAQGTLANDYQAEDDVREFVMRYVQHHRGLLEGDRECLAAIMDVVDVFVNAGWPKWIGVVAELDGIYRSS